MSRRRCQLATPGESIDHALGTCCEPNTRTGRVRWCVTVLHPPRGQGYNGKWKFFLWEVENHRRGGEKVKIYGQRRVRHHQRWTSISENIIIVLHYSLVQDIHFHQFIWINICFLFLKISHDNIWFLKDRKLKFSY